MSLDSAAHEILSGRRRDAAAILVRGLTSLAEPLYRMAIGRRNRRYDRDPRRSHWLPRPVISVGNLTTGGTGKTPVVRWLAEQLRGRGLCVAVLSRGYRARPGEWGDEQKMLDGLLNPPGSPLPRVLIQSHPNRLEAGHSLLRSFPEIDVFILDDGFQHRRLARDLDIVLINAKEPFGFDHLLPRGLLREPVGSLKRANAVLLTHADAVSPPQLKAITRKIQHVIANLPVHQCIHAPAGISGIATGASAHGEKVVAFSGIGYPEGFEQEMRQSGMMLAGNQRFADHHDYTADDLKRLQDLAVKSGAVAMVTTEKDWVKIRPLAEAHRLSVPVWRLDVRTAFIDGSESQLIEQILQAIRRSSHRRHQR